MCYNRYLNFKEIINMGNNSTEMTISKNELITYFKLNEELLTNQYTMRKLSKDPIIRESIKKHCLEYNKLSHKIYSLLMPCTCSICGINTSFNDRTKKFSELCKEHRSFSSSKHRKENSIIKAIDLLKPMYNIINEPESLNDDKFTLQCNECSNEFDVWLKNGKINKRINNLCPRCNPRKISSFEYDIKDWLESLNIEVIQQYIIAKNGKGRTTVDIFLPKYNIAIEYSGIMFHSYGISKYSMFDNVDIENKNKHLEKTIMCNDLGIQLLQIFSNEWTYNEELWKSVILNKCGMSNKLYARKCKISQLTNAEYSSFMVDNHLQGSCNSSTKIGLIYNNELVCAIGFSKSRYRNNIDYELIRFCNKRNTTVVGGFSKLLKYFKSIHNNASIVSYANMRWSNGNMYHKNNFILEKISSPNYFYFKDSSDVLESRLLYQKHKLPDSAITESSYMFENGYRRIWDCGNYVFILK